MNSSSERQQDGGHTASVQLVISQEGSHTSFGQPSSEQGGLGWAVMKEIPKCPLSPCNLNDIRKSDAGLTSGSVWGEVSSSTPSPLLLHNAAPLWGCFYLWQGLR